MWMKWVCLQENIEENINIEALILRGTRVIMPNNHSAIYVTVHSRVAVAIPVAAVVSNTNESRSTCNKSGTPLP